MRCGTGTGAQSRYTCTANGWRQATTCTEECAKNAPATPTQPTTVSTCAANSELGLPKGKTSDTPIKKCVPGQMKCGTGTSAQIRYTCTANGWRSAITCTEECTPKNESSKTCECVNGKFSSACGEDAGTPCGDNTGGRPSCSGQKVVNGDKVEYSCQSNCKEAGLQSSSSGLSCGGGKYCCYKDIAAGEKPNPTTKPSSGNNGGGGNNTSGNTGSGSSSSSCPAEEDNCFYTENGKCYSGHGPKSGINVKGCEYSCGPVDNSKCKTSSKEEKKNTKREYIDCNPGDAVDEGEEDCPKGKKGTCGGHYYCVWSEEGTYKSDFICETEKETCSDKEDEEKSEGGSCKDNPTSPPDGYTWKNSCKSCGSNDDCPQNTKDSAVNPDTSNWCFGGKCLMLVSGGSSSKSDKKDDGKKDNKDKDKKKKDDKKKKNKDDGKTKDDTGNRNKNHSKNDKTDREKAQKPIDKKNKQLAAEGKPTLTPLPPDNGEYEAYKNNTTTTATPTVSPTPLPPLDEPKNWQAFCAQTTDEKRPWGIKVSWDAVPNATRYAVRIDEDAPSWEGDTPSPGDTVDNQVTNSYYIREAKQGSTYQWWVHSVNASGVYSALTKKMLVTCPSANSKSGSPTPQSQSVGAGQLLVLPESNTTAITTAPTPTTKPTATPTPKR
jgi:hypothetical protein